MSKIICYEYFNIIYDISKGDKVMKKRIAIMFAVIAVLLCTGIAGYSVYAAATTDNDTISKGVYIDTVDVSEMTKEQAIEAMNSYIAKRESKALTVKVDEHIVAVKLEELGYGVAENNIIEEALEVGKSGNLIKRYKEIKDTKEKGLTFNIEFTLSDILLRDLVEVKCSQFNIPAENATVTRKDGVFIVAEHVVGRKVIVDETIEKIKSNILNNWDGEDITIDAVVIDDIPQYQKDSLEKIDTVLGSFETYFASSSASRATNVAVGAKFIDGTVLYPGEIFSAYEHLSPFTVNNGYATAGAYSQGMVIDSVGGGICQVSSTLYNAVLRAELEIVERAAHSMSVSYVKPAMDAAIAGTYKDLKFKNNLSTPIYIQGYTVGRTIYFNIYGEETRDIEKRKVEFVSEVTDTIPAPKEVVTEDPTMPTTYRKVTQSSHTGLKAKLYKVVYEDGKEVSRELINSSSYAATPAYVIVGTKEEVTDEDIENKGKTLKKPKVPKDDQVDIKEPEEDYEDEPIDEPIDNVSVDEIIDDGNLENIE